jgi:DNA-binding transcriptional MerR regulator
MRFRQGWIIDTPIFLETYMTDKSEALFTIQQISLKLDIPKSTLRFWEKELGGFILPIRTSGGQRRYDLKDLSIIDKVKEFRTRGMSLTEIKTHLQPQTAGQDGAKQQQLGNIDLLAERVAEAIKAEIYKFLSSHTLADVD